jgi:hypothetical protein
LPDVLRPLTGTLMIRVFDAITTAMLLVLVVIVVAVLA